MSIVQMLPVIMAFRAALGGLATQVVEAQLLAADETLVKSTGLRTDGPALLEYFRKMTLDEWDKAALQRSVMQLSDKSFRLREKASAELKKWGRAALPYLQRAVQHPNSLESARRANLCLQAIEQTWGTDVPAAVARLLASRPPAGTLPVVLNYLPQVDDATVETELRAVLRKVGLRDGLAVAPLVAALTDRQPSVRQAASWVVGRSTDGKQRALVRPLLTDPDPGVRLRAAQGLLAGRDREAIPALVALLGDTPLTVARAAEELLCRLAGERAPPISLTEDEAGRGKCRAEWDRWWRAHGHQLDLSRYDLANTALGYTLFCALNGGRVWETARDGKVRWEIKSLQGPVEAEILPGNRVLIAEQGAQRVTERTFTGKILWEYRVPDSLVGCQRLPNGNTFLVTHQRLFEIDPRKNLVKTYLKATEVVYSGQKLANGHVLYLGSNQRLTELDGRGGVVKAWKVDISGIGLVRAQVVPGGVLLGEINRLVEFNSTGKVVWESAAARSMASAVRLPNGNVLACSHINNRMMEVSREGKLLREQPIAGSPVRIRWR